MRLARLFVVSMFLVSPFAACSGDDGGSGGNIDAPKVIDAPPDAPAAVSGLGKKCDVAMMNADCPANAPNCVGFTGTPTYCSPLCVTAGTATGVAGTPPSLGMIMPAPSDTTCSGAFSGTIGTARCVGILSNYMPADATIVVGRAYTNVNMTCAVLCGAANACPPGMASNTSLGACICVPM